MAGRTIHKLPDTAVQAKKTPDRYSDGLYLNVAARATKSSLFMWTPKGSQEVAQRLLTQARNGTGLLPRRDARKGAGVVAG
jgi:hypothetical protein